MKSLRTSTSMVLCAMLLFFVGRSLADDKNMAELYLDYHNHLRQRVGASLLVWNDTLAERAHKYTADRSDCRDPPSYEPDVNFFFNPRTTNKEAARCYHNAMDWESYGFDPVSQSCNELYPCDSFKKIARPNVRSVGCSDNPCDVRGTLILCYFSPLLVQRQLKGGSTGPPRVNQHKYIDGFNELRERKEIPPLEWDEGLGKKARAFTDEHRAPMACEGMDRKKSPMNEYIFYSQKDDNAEDVVQYMFKAIGWEGFAYDPELQSCPTGMDCDHFIRIASPDTLHVGCSVVECVGCVGTLIVCYFDPRAKRN